MTRLEEAYELVEKLGSIAEEIKHELKDSEDLLERKSQAISEASETLETMRKDFNIKQQWYANEQESLEEDIQPLRDELVRVKSEISVESDRLADIKVENSRLTKENYKLSQYEASALKVLRAKDLELIEREKRISQKENLSPGTKSFLPPQN